MLIEEIFEDEGELWTEGKFSWISINIDSYQSRMIQVVDCAFCPCVVVLLGAAYCQASSQSVSGV